MKISWKWFVMIIIENDFLQVIKCVIDEYPVERWFLRVSPRVLVLWKFNIISALGGPYG